MNISRTVTTACAAFCLSASAALASDGVLPSSDSVFTKWGETEGWTIYKDETRKSCLAERVDEAGNVLQMGLTAEHTLGYIGVFTQADIGLSEGKEKLLIAIDGDLYEGEAQQKSKHLADGYTGGYVVSSDADFVTDIMKKYEMVVMPEHEGAFIINLDGTYKAIEESRKCNEEIGA
ncbi:hypothetical protein AB9K34_21220 [Sedimentitalea sp. XS_ASV28]|uniref:hypothetical protein n=1 Tax=Sedimentitalea sp. XS_ASV28 TaxID=3241296 RepID=UPI0035197378